jgi:hypothetical protein
MSGFLQEGEDVEAKPPEREIRDTDSNSQARNLTQSEGVLFRFPSPFDCSQPLSILRQLEGTG